jgi:hypothetical protein
LRRSKSHRNLIGFICQAVGIKYVFITLAGDGLLYIAILQLNISFLFSCNWVLQPDRNTYSQACQVGAWLYYYTLMRLSRETYGPLLQLKSATRSTDPEKPLAQTEKPPRTWSYMWINLSRPLSLLFKSLICFMLSLYMALRVFSINPSLH